MGLFYCIVICRESDQCDKVCDFFFLFCDGRYVCQYIDVFKGYLWALNIRIWLSKVKIYMMDLDVDRLIKGSINIKKVIEIECVCVFFVCTCVCVVRVMLVCINMFRSITATYSLGE